MQIAGSVALVTGANRGLGRELAKALVERGAKVYAAARRPESVDLDGVVPIQLDITDPASIAAAAEKANDVNLLVNNAGTGSGADLLTGDLAEIRQHMDTHFYGTLAVTRAFAPGLKGGALLNVLSVASWAITPGLDAYSAAKTAQWALTNSLRVRLAEQGTVVSGLHVGYIDTDLTAALDVPKHAPADIANLAIDGVAAGQHEILADDISRTVRSALSGPLENLYPSLV
jgi:NAD(P)-dependent dehydrogenase (short-subunit alcohol dehydrogenase family)